MTDIYPQEPTGPSWRLWAVIGGAVVLVAGIVAVLVVAYRPVDPNEHLAAARRHLEAGERLAAIIELRNAVRAEPENVRVRQTVGLTALYLGDVQAAAKNLILARQRSEDDSQVLLPLAEAYLRLGEAERLLRSIVPGDRGAEIEARVLDFRARAHLALDDVAAARAAVDQAREIAPDLADARLTDAELQIRAGETKAAEAAVDDVLASQPDYDRALLLKAKLRRTAEDDAGAAAAFTDVIRSNAFLPHGWIGRAAIRLGDDQLADAKADIDALLARYPRHPIGHYLRGLYHAKAGNDADAITALQQMSGLQRRHPPALYLMSVLNVRNDQLEQAETNLRTLLGYTPDNVTVHRLLADVYMRKQRPDRAAALLQPLVEDDPDNAELAAGLAEAYLRDDRAAEASRLFERLIEKDPDNLQLRTRVALSRLQQGEADTAIADLERILAVDPTVARANLVLVTTHLRADRLDQALAAAQRMRQSMPDSAVPDNLIGSILVQSGDPAGAREAFETALAKYAKFDPAIMNLAALDVQEGKLGQARRRYLDILARNENDVRAMQALAILERLAGSAEAELQWRRRAVDAAPDATEPRVELIDTLLARRRFAEALDLARGFAETSTDNPQALDVLGRAYLMTGQAANAVSTFRRLVFARPQSAQAHRRLANALVAFNSPSEARLALQDAIKLAPGSPSLYADLARLELADRQYDAALAAATKVRDLVPERGLGYVLIGHIKLQAGDTAGAIAGYQEAFERAPSGPMVYRLYEAYVGADKPEQALATLDAWLDANPDDHGIMLARATHYLRGGQHTQALPEFEKLLQLLPDNHIVLNNLALLYDRIGDPRALETAERAYAAASSVPEVADTLGWILAMRGDGKRAVEVLRPAAEARPKNLALQYHLAYAYHVAGADERAADLLKALLARGEAFDGDTAATALLDRLTR